MSGFFCTPAVALFLLMIVRVLLLPYSCRSRRKGPISHSRAAIASFLLNLEDGSMAEATPSVVHHLVTLPSSQGAARQAVALSNVSRHKVRGGAVCADITADADGADCVWLLLVGVWHVSVHPAHAKPPALLTHSPNSRSWILAWRLCWRMGESARISAIRSWSIVTSTLRRSSNGLL